jgi:hypothetical protein
VKTRGSFYTASTQSGPLVSLRKGPVAGEKRSSESEDYASKVRATPLSYFVVASG